MYFWTLMKMPLILLRSGMVLSYDKRVNPDGEYSTLFLFQKK